MLIPADFASGPVSDAERVTRFCGHCAFFEVWALGGGGDCQKGHDCTERAHAGTCPDKHELSHGSGPLFDMSE